MKDHLLDIVAHTHGLEVFEMVKIVGSEDSTSLTAIGKDNSVVLEAKFIGVIPEFVGTFGMPNLSKLNTLLNIPEYANDATITMGQQEKDGKKIPSEINFENKTGDFKNTYRLMSANVLDSRLSNIKFNGANWNVELEPAEAAIQKFRFQSTANSEFTNFTAKSEGDALKFYFGDHSSHSGNFIFANGVKGKLKRSLSWPKDIFVKVLSLPGDKLIKFSDDGASMITVNSGLAIYNYIVVAQVK
jgi:hypothetical protein